MYRPLLTSLLFLLLVNSAGFTQGFKDPFRYSDQNTIIGGVGYTFIDDTAYTTFTLAPEFSFGKVGVGLYLQLLFNNENSFTLRKSEYKDGAGILRAIRYIRIGQKYDPYFFRFGALDRATLGNGFLMWNYNNGTNYDKRRLGLVADVDFGRFGFESVIGSLSSSTVQGYNVFLRPFRLANVDNFLLQRFRVHTTFVRDNKISIADTTNSLSAYGFGADLQWLDLRLIKSSIYTDYAKFNDYGSGQAYGLGFVFPEFAGLFGLSVNLEKRFLNSQFIPNFFGPLYELERQVGALDSLQRARKTEGVFGQLAGHVLNRLRLLGSYTHLQNTPAGGAVHLEASAPDLVPRFELRAYYDKSRISSLDDVRTLDARSVATAEIGYELNNYLLLSTIYRWYWVEVSPNVFKPKERIEPRLSFRYNF